MVKRPASTAGSPPPLSASTSTATGIPKAKKPRTTKPKKSKKGAGGDSTPAGSPPPGTPGFASSPPAGGAGSPPVRGRSQSVFDGEGTTTTGGGGKKGKGKGKAAQNVEEEAEEQQPLEDQDAEDEDDLEFSDDEFGSNAQEIAKQKEDLRVLLEHFDSEQMNRYEHYRRSGLNKASVRKLVNQVLGQTVSPSILTVVRGFAKVFVGEIVEKARTNNPHPGPLTPQDLRDAYRVYLQEHEGPGAGGQGGGRKKMFVR
ncbi:TATA-binding protein-associated factor TAF11 [Sporobolomyces salmoneus]|uniref:TATA-binding protein-associated factor TAF11 n=1 Tax=Sporobolomyces salmoneus TaxID=183962 RepID=UPI00317F3A4D